MLIVCCTIILVSVSLLIVYGLRPRQRWRYRHIPGPKPHWMLGNLEEIVRKGKHEAFLSWAREYGRVFKVFEGGVVSVVVQEPKLAREVNGRNHNRHPIPYMETGEEEKFNSQGILFARNAYHRGLRAAWQPMFYTASLKGFLETFDDAALNLASRLEIAASEANSVDIHAMIGDMVMHLSSTTVFGMSMNGNGTSSSDSEAKNLLSASRAFFRAAGEIENIYALLQLVFPPFAPIARNIATLYPTQTYAAGLAGRKVVRKAIIDMLKRQNAHSKSTTERMERDRTPGTAVSKGSFLDLMTSAVNRETGDPLNNAEAACQAFSFVLAATETSTAALAFAIYLIATHPEVEKNILEEIDRFGRDKTPKYEDIIESFPYVEAVFKESLRLYPPVPITIREAERDMHLDQKFIPSGTYLAVNVYGMHRDPAYWSQPERFKPERFLQGNEPFEKLAYMPFGDGTRACIGQRYAWLEAKLVLIRIYQRVQIRLAEGSNSKLNVRMALGLTPRNGLNIRCCSRVPRKHSAQKARQAESTIS